MVASSELAIETRIRTQSSIHSNPFKIMKKRVSFLFNALFFSALLLTAVSCKKKDTDPKPDLATSVAGTYTMTYVNDDGDEYTLPFNQQGVTISGTVRLTKVNENTASGKITLVINGDAESQDVGNITLKDKGNGEVGLYEDNDQVGKIKNGELEINASEGGATYIVRAEK
jgi:hypothetical protein